jgi:SAM-dependent methyltransferase
MKIIVIEWDISVLAGRQKTMLCFADYLSEMGHEVQVWSNFNNEREGYNPDTFRQWHLFKWRRMPVFDFGRLQRKYKPKEIPREWRDADMILCPYGNYGHIQKHLPNTKVVCWTIHPDQVYHADVYEVWTNSKTTQRWLLETDRHRESEGKMRIVIPPHDYSLFRRRAKPFADREIDAVTVGVAIHNKGIAEFDAFCQQTGLNGMIITSYSIKRDENLEIIGQLKTAHVVNATAHDVATILGNSKVFMLWTETESCALAIYEAMNAGCRCVVKGPAGAAAEQMGPHGRFFFDPRHAERAVLDVLENPGPSPVEHAKQFDREHVAWMLNDRIDSMAPDDRYWQGWDRGDLIDTVESHWDTAQQRTARQQYHEFLMHLVAPAADHDGAKLDDVLDVGCGTGQDWAILTSLGLQYNGWDSSEAMIERARKANPDMTVSHRDLFDCPAVSEGQRYDLVTCNAVLPHMPRHLIERAFDYLWSFTRRCLVVRMFGIDRFEITTSHVRKGFLYTSYTRSRFQELIRRLPDTRGVDYQYGRAETDGIAIAAIWRADAKQDAPNGS